MPRRRLRVVDSSTLPPAYGPYQLPIKRPCHSCLLLWLGGSGLVVALVIALLLLLLLLWYHRTSLPPLRGRWAGRRKSSRVYCKQLRRYSYKELKKATANFSAAQALGKGGFGVVYRGMLSDGQEVAVKKLDLSSLQGEREFQNELSVSGGLSSPYVVNILGYCTHGKRVRLLVYECMPNRSLQEVLFHKHDPGPRENTANAKSAVTPALPWEKRFKIIVDIARALAFLHLECKPPIIHGDVKPSNILLDANFSARIADFGLARFKTDEYWVEADITVSARPSVSTSAPALFRPSTPRRAPERDVETEELADKSVISTSVVPEKPEDCNEQPFDTAMPETVCVSPATVEISECCNELEEVELGQASPNTTGITDRNSSPPASSCSNNNQVPSPRKQQRWAGRDWWWKQENSGELSVKDYVMEWLGNELKTNRATPTAKGDGPPSAVTIPSPLAAPPLDTTTTTATTITTTVNSNKKTEAESKKKKAKKSREWWKDEYFAELNNKRKKKGRAANGNGGAATPWWRGDVMADQFSGDLTGFSGDLIRRVDSWRSTRPGNTARSREYCSRDTLSGDLGMLSKRKQRNKRGSSTAISDMWSGDLLANRHNQFSGDLLNNNNNNNYNCNWSGDLGRQFYSGELVSRDASSTTSMRGTVCYVAPECGGCGVLSEKGDIYSLGVLVLVIISGRRPIQIAASPVKDLERANLVSWARVLAAHSSPGNILDLVDQRLQGSFDREQVMLCITLALMCLQRLPASRPGISELLRILTGELPAPPFPPDCSPSPSRYVTK